VRLNSSPQLLQTLNDLPIKQVNNATVYIRDVAHVRDGFAVQTNIVAQNRVRSALLTVLKSASASTLDIISRVKAALPRIKATLPPELDITQLFDQSIFVRASINGVLREGLIAACLTALMILLFLGNWRSTLVVATSIPLSILSSILVLGALGQTLNIMTLGGLALAVGGSGNTGTQLFNIVQSDPLRVYVYAPQENAPSIHEGLSAKILLDEFPGQEFDGMVTRTAGALDPQSRTMQVEVQVPNHDGKLYAGMYGQVKFLLTDDNAPIVVPANAFRFRTGGPQVATIENNDRIHWQNIRVGRDFGDRIEVLDGLKENTKVVMNPSDDLREGIQVEVKSTEESKPASTVAQSASNR